MNNKVIVIAGPTATGKTALSVHLAKKLGGEVISADSVQIYQKLNIGSAKPTPEEMGGIPHHMMDFLTPDSAFSVADFCALAKTQITDILFRGKMPIVAGGTGLYISSLMDNVTFSEEASEDLSVRVALQKRLETEGKEALHAYLRQVDPTSAAAIHENNTKRVIRALEIFEKTGKTMTEQNEVSKCEKSPFVFLPCALTCQRDLLYERINQRVDIMVQQGLFDEVEALLKGGVSKDCQSMQGIGYKEVVAYFDGQATKEECIEQIKQGSRRYAKRQLTWFKRGNYQWFDCLKETVKDEVTNYIGEQL